jgi:selenide, water dikinase
VRPDVVVDHAYSDDAAIVRVPAGRDLVLTADVIAPLVDDAAAFGSIAAANSLSDVWAMGGEPRFALNLVFFPDDTLPLELLDDILAGAARTCAEAGVAVVGGHSVRDPEIKFGLSVTGDVGPGELWTNRTARPGQALVLTKALGTGVIGQAIKKGIASEAAMATAIRSMTTTNQRAARIGHAHGVTAATDVTGFGLPGHLRNMLRASGVAAEVEAGAVPLLPGVAELAADGCIPGGTRRNLEDLADDALWDDSLTELQRLLLCDAQTSGGLLISVPADRADALCAALRDEQTPVAVVIGRITDGLPGRIRILG